MYESLRKHIELFTPIPDEDWQLLLPHLTQRTLKKNTLFTKEGKVCKEIGFVIAGNMRHYYTKDGVEKATYLFHNNIALFTGILLFAHSCFDRVLGYGLKFTDDFKHTHLGMIGNKKEIE